MEDALLCGSHRVVTASDEKSQLSQRQNQVIVKELAIESQII